MGTFALAAPLFLAGLLPIQSEHTERWGLAGAWQLPIGDRDSLGSSSGGAPPYQQNRGVERSRGRVTHQGADLANGHSADTVRAAASGLVVHTERNASNGYGGHIVIAHRLPDGGMVYSVYAHLQVGTIRVRAGESVGAGEPIARVGQTGRASTPHLHFEIRTVTDPAVRWEKTAVLDPVEFVLQRLPRHGADTTWARPYLVWAELEALIPSEIESHASLSRGVWWNMLGNAARLPAIDVRSDAETVRDSLVAWSVLPLDELRRDPDDRLDWETLARDLRVLRERPMRVGPPEIPHETHLESCERQFGVRAPLDDLAHLARREGAPTVESACVLLASACGPFEPPILKTQPSAKPARSKRRPKPKPPRA